MARLSIASDIINRVAAEVGLLKVADPLSSVDETFIQLSELLNAAGQELVELWPWQVLVKPFQVVTQDTDSGTYDLPDDFSYMIDQTGWEHSNRVAIGGPLSAQDWTYLAGRDLISQSIYASFRLVDNKFDIYPQDPVPAGLDINFEYISRNWVQEQGTGDLSDLVTVGSDVVLYEPILIIKFLKVKWLQAKGFDTTAAVTELENIWGSRTGKDTGAAVLNASRGSRGMPYLSAYGSTPDTGFGM
ncbi:hypothetical protein DRQ32_04210 [bacterium]|nr:MAG: hypothetical protein DRQ32_04210 [bacterium]